MADWSKIKFRGNVDDRRTRAPLYIGGVSLTGLVLYLIIGFLSGGEVQIDPRQLDQVLPESTKGTVVNPEYEGSDPYEEFASTVLGSTNEVWTRIFLDSDLTYNEPTLVLFRQATSSACGAATSAVGPHYCPIDGVIYLDETFFDELQARFGSQGGDVAEAYGYTH